MSEEGFLGRWARRKSESRQGVEPAPEPLHELAAEKQPALQPAPIDVAKATATPMPAVPEPAPLPTMADVAALTGDSDYSAFVVRGVDQAVRRGALKKLFADPHFNVMDRLDMYMDDYNVASPMPDGMLAALQHSKSFFARAAEDAQARAEKEAAALAASAPLPEELPSMLAADAQEPAPALAIPDIEDRTVTAMKTTSTTPEQETQ